MLTRRRFAFAAGAALGASVAGASAQTYPDRPVRIVAGFPPGGGIDIVARFLSEPLKDAFGQPFIVDNRTGAAGMIAAQAVAKARRPTATCC